MLDSEARGGVEVEEEEEEEDEEDEAEGAGSDVSMKAAKGGDKSGDEDAFNDIDERKLVAKLERDEKSRHGSFIDNGSDAETDE